MYPWPLTISFSCLSLVEFRRASSLSPDLGEQAMSPGYAGYAYMFQMCYHCVDCDSTLECSGSIIGYEPRSLTFSWDQFRPGKHCKLETRHDLLHQQQYNERFQPHLKDRKAECKGPPRVVRKFSFLSLMDLPV